MDLTRRSLPATDLTAAEILAAESGVGRRS